MNLTTNDITEALEEARKIMSEFVMRGKSRAMIEAQLAIVMELESALRDSVKNGGLLCLK